MDKIKKYQDIIINFLNYYQAETGGNQPDDTVKRTVLTDREHNSFQLLSAGWNGNHYVFGPLFHFDIIDGKIWMQCNNTEWEVVDYLMTHGVDRQDIVLGFIPPKARHLSGFAEA
ncbi:MAG: XisI protein [Bacteroidota bacterium]